MPLSVPKAHLQQCQGMKSRKQANLRCQLVNIVGTGPTADTVLPGIDCAKYCVTASAISFTLATTSRT